MNKISTKKTIHLSTPKMKAELVNKFTEEPSNSIINNILNYSKALSIRSSKNIEHFEMVLN